MSNFIQNKVLSGKKLVIFDCDGVLVDSEMVSNRIFAEALTAYGYILTAEQSIKKFTGMNDHTARQLIYEESGIEMPFSVFTDQYPDVLAAFKNELEPLMSATLKGLEERKITRCVASSSPRERVLLSLNLTKQLHFFNEDSIFTSQQVENGKPAPDLFLFAAEQMGFLPEDCLVIEDSFAGIQAAKLAGMKAIGFLGGAHAQYDWYEEMIKFHDIPIAYTEKDLLPILDKWLADTPMQCGSEL